VNSDDGEAILDAEYAWAGAAEMELMEMSCRRTGEQVLRPGLHFILEWGDGLGDVIITSRL
jgi:hypothetical protein